MRRYRCPRCQRDDPRGFDRARPGELVCMSCSTVFSVPALRRPVVARWDPADPSLEESDADDRSDAAVPSPEPDPALCPDGVAPVDELGEDSDSRVVRQDDP